MSLPRFGFLIALLLGLHSALIAAEKTFVITDYGALAGGEKLNTVAIQAAIDAAAESKGGTVVIPAGVFRSGSIFLKPGVALHLEAGAVLKGSENIEDYPKRRTRIEGHFPEWRMALVNASEMTGLRISGEGKLDGSGPVFWRAFWQRRKENPQCTNLEVERPRLLFIDRCTDVRITGLRLEDSGFWNLHLYRCRDVTIEELRITIPSSTPELAAPSTDGIDIDSSQNVTVRRCFISTHDDNIALKGSKGPLADQDKDSPPVENILVEDTTVGSGNGLITCGSEATLVRNVTVRNCVMIARATMLTIKLRPDTPQHYENILIDGVRLEGNGRLFNMAPWTQFFDLKGHPPPTRRVNNITVRNVSGSYRTLGTLRGNPGDVLEDFTLENIAVTLADEKFTVGEIKNLALKNVVVNGKALELPTR
ncbi:glycoside hydrolase family 28 protein [Oleiharenicola lentus]|uniref:glycoside hydrolase family 28 protein n=1 Tax=Oleiharenicola lentus TaxID=2508720 RepID=UPI003F66C887